MQDVEVTIVVPVLNRRERMLRCLEALLDLEYDKYEILIIDNGSDDGTFEACVQRAEGAAIPIRVERVSGTLGRVRNAGARLANGRYVAYTDSDCMPAPGWLRAATDALDADAGLGMVCGVTRPESADRSDWAHTIEITTFTSKFESCNIVYRTMALLEAGGFDEVVGDGWEDTAAGYAMLERGWRGGFSADAQVVHDVTYPGYWPQVRRERRQRNLAYLIARHPGVRRTLFLGLFLNLRSALFACAAAGLLFGARKPAARWLALPYLPWALRLGRPNRIARLMVYDAALHVHVLRGALRHRVLVL